MNNKENPFDMGDIERHWCPGCGNFAIIDSLQKALIELGKKPQDIIIISGIGQAGKTPHFMFCNYINGLHGRTLPVAMAVKALNPEMLVFAIGGDGDMYAEGGNHLMHAIRRNINVVTIVHNNMVYGLTKGQASPTSQKGFTTKVQKYGVFDKPFNPISFAISQDASFVARAYSADKDKTKEVLKKAIKHQGFAIIDIFQPCVSFNKVNTYKWFKDHTYYLEEKYDPTDKIDAFKKSLETEKFPLGIIYKNEERKTFEEQLPVYADNKTPVIKRKRDIQKVLSTLLK